MPVRNISRVKINIQKKVEEISSVTTERAIRSILQGAQGYANVLTPRDTGHLLNSSFLTMLAPNHGRVGYTAAYAFWVHNMPGKLKGQPRAHFGRTRAGVDFGGGTGRGNYWDPAAEPQFLIKGFEAIKPSIPNILKAVYGS